MLKDKFNKAVLFVRSPPVNSTIPTSLDQKLIMYALYKQATVGPCSLHGGNKPWSVQMEAVSKWNAWNDLQDMSQEEAMTKYIAMLDSIVPTWNA